MQLAVARIPYQIRPVRGEGETTAWKANAIIGSRSVLALVRTVGGGAWHESGSTFVAKVSRDLCMLYPRDWPDRFLLRCSLLLTADLGS